MPDPPAEGDPVLLAVDDGRCVFHDAGACRCRIQTALGHEALPLACRQFPRVTVRDPRGVSVTLSHYCPTAASMLDDRAQVRIVDEAPAFPSGGEYVGLDARSSLPPLLRPDMLMDWESWWEWERQSVECLTESSGSAAEALAGLAAAVENVRSWRPGDGLLIDRVRSAFNQPIPHGAPSFADDTTVQDVLDAIPDAHRPAMPPLAGTVPDSTMRRYLSAHAFANWTAHLGRGLRTWRRSVETAYVLAGSYGVRHADLWLRHLADPARLADRFNTAERSGG